MKSENRDVFSRIKMMVNFSSLFETMMANELYRCKLFCLTIYKRGRGTKISINAFEQKFPKETVQNNCFHK